MMRYVLGFVFTGFECNMVLLQQKMKPAWQSGKYNGIGGKIEEGETTSDAMCRESLEEVDWGSHKPQWIPFGEMKDQEETWHVSCFTCRIPNDHDALKAREDEPIRWCSINCLPTACLTNLAWVVPIARHVALGSGFAIDFVSVESPYE